MAPRARKPRSLKVRLDGESKTDFARSQVISLTSAELLEFWNALHAPVKLTPAQKKLGRIMQGRA